MEGLSVAASGMAVVSLTFQLADGVRKLCEFWASIQEAPEDIRETAMELDILSCVLAQIAYELQNVTPDDTLRSALERCSDQVTRLTTILNDIEPGFISASLRIRKWTAFKFVLKNGQLTKFQSGLERLKTTLLLVQQNQYSRLSRNRYISLEQNLVNITQLVSSLSIQNQSLMNRGKESMDANVGSSQVSFPTDESDTAVLNTKDLITVESHRLEPDLRIQKRILTRSPLGYYASVMESFLGTINTKTRTFRLTSEDMDDQNESWNEDQYEQETSYIIHPAAWLIRLGIQYGLNVKLLSSSSKGWQNTLNTIHLVPNDALVFDFCRQGNTLAVRKLISKGLASARDMDSDGWTPLHYAANHHHANLCKTLIGAGADINATTMIGITPMYLASASVWESSSGPLSRIFETCVLLAKTSDLLNDKGACGENLCIISLQSENSRLHGDPSAISALKFRLLNRLSSEWQSYLTIIEFWSLLDSVASLSPRSTEVLKILISLGMKAFGDTILGSFEFFNRVIKAALFPFAMRQRNYLQAILEFGPDLYHVGFGQDNTNHESVTSLAMYTSLAFFRWSHELRNKGLDLEVFVKEEWKRNCEMHPGWSQRTLLKLFEFDCDTDISLSRVACCADCDSICSDMFVQPSWRHLLESIKLGIEVTISQYIVSTKGKYGSENLTSDSKARTLGDELSQQPEYSGKNKSYDGEVEAEWASNLTEPLDSHSYPSKISLTSKSPYDWNKVVCWDCWLYFICTGTRNTRPWEVRSSDQDISQAEEGESEDDFSPYHVHT